MEKQVKEKKASYQEELEISTNSLFNNPEGKAWIRLMKRHPDVRYYESNVKASKDSTTGTAYFDGACQFIRIIEQILDNQK